MKIHDDHLYHGAALIQVAEHPQFTAINSLNVDGEAHRSAYKVNDHIGIFLKYSVTPSRNYDEYTFTFNTDHLDALQQIDGKVETLVLVLVCVKDRGTCCITYDEFMKMVEKRRELKGSEEGQYIVKVTVPEGKSMRAYLDFPGKKKTILGEIIVPRNRFPDLLFER